MKLHYSIQFDHFHSHYFNSRDLFERHNTRVVLSQGGPRDAAVNLGAYRSLGGITAIARLSNLIIA